MGGLSDKADHAASPLVKSQKVKRFRFPRPIPLPVPFGEPPELNQACFLRVQFQPVFRHPFPQLFKEAVGFVAMLKPQHKVVRVSND